MTPLLLSIIYQFNILKVCGTTDCCFTPWSVNSVDEGEGVYLSGPSDLGECNQYDVNDGSQNNEIGIYFQRLRLNLNFNSKLKLGILIGILFLFLGITVYHQGFDAVRLDFVNVTLVVEMGGLQAFQCDINEWINNGESQINDECYG